MRHNVHVISSELDGSELKREKAKNSYHVVCDGKTDNEDIQEALETKGKTTFYGIPPHKWENIFGDK